MKVELERLVYPEAAEEVTCSLCERPFTLGLVIARACSRPPGLRRGLQTVRHLPGGGADGSEREVPHRRGLRATGCRVAHARVRFG